MRTRLLAIPLVAIAALGLSGCFSFSALQFSKIKLKPGSARNSTSNVTVKAFPSGSTPNAIFFILVGLPNGGTDGDTSDDALKINGNKGLFDTTEKFGNRPKELNPSAVLRDTLVDDAACGSLDLDTSVQKYVVLATGNRVHDQGRKGTVAVSKFTLKQTQESVDLQPAGILIATGFWDDANDNGIPDPGGGFFTPSEYGCTGGALSNIHLKPAPSAKAGPSRAQRERYTP